MLRIAIPKGSLLDDSKEFLKKNNIEFEHADRKLLFKTNKENIEVLIVRPTDVAVYVEKGAVDIGIVGSDILDEYDSDVLRLCNLGFGECSLGVAAPQGSNINSISDVADYSSVASKFTNMTSKYFKKQGIPVDIIGLYGSIEIAPLTGLSDIIVDLVGTGKTLRENGLDLIETISVHTAHLISNKNSWQLHHDLIRELIPAS